MLVTLKETKDYHHHIFRSSAPNCRHNASHHIPFLASVDCHSRSSQPVRAQLLCRQLQDQQLVTPQAGTRTWGQYNNYDLNHSLLSNFPLSRKDGFKICIPLNIHILQKVTLFSHFVFIICYLVIMSCIVSFIVDLLLVDIYLWINRQQPFCSFVAFNFTS